jgi:hypothetical protein
MEGAGGLGHRVIESRIIRQIGCSRLAKFCIELRFFYRVRTGFERGMFSW